MSSSSDGNINDNSNDGANIPEEVEDSYSILPIDHISVKQKIQNIKTNEFRIKLSSLREAYKNDGIVKTHNDFSHPADEIK